ncbi:mutator type transposase [Tanacetum coccineum]
MIGISVKQNGLRIIKGIMEWLELQNNVTTVILNENQGIEDDDDNAYVISLDMRKLGMPLVRKLGLTVDVLVKKGRFRYLHNSGQDPISVVNAFFFIPFIFKLPLVFSKQCVDIASRAKCDVLLNNLCEVFNRQLVDGRDVPIITCLEFVREYLMKRIINVKKVISKSKGPLTPVATKLFDAIKYKASFYTVLRNGGTKYQASGPYKDQCVVDIQEKNCSCRKWELIGMPCKHAVAVINDMALNNAAETRRGGVNSGCGGGGGEGGDGDSNKRSMRVIGLGGASMILSRKGLDGGGEGVSFEEGGEDCGFDSNEDEVVPKVNDASLVDGVFEGAFGGDGDEDFVIGEGVVVSSSSLVKSTKSFLSGMMVSLIFLERLKEVAWVEAMEVEEE